MKNLPALILALRRGDLEKSAFLHQLDKMVEGVVSAKHKLHKVEVPAQDQAVWEELFRPGLKAAWRCLLAAVDEARIFASTREAQRLPGIYQLLDNAERILGVLTQSVHRLSGWTQQEMMEKLSDLLQSHQQPGHGADPTLNSQTPPDAAEQQTLAQQGPAAESEAL